MTDDFRHRTRLEVRLGDLDPFGHVNNAVIATYVEQGRVLYLRDVLGTGADPVSMPFILARLEIDYLLADRVHRPGRGVARASTGSAAPASHMSHLLTGCEGRELARSEAVLVAFDYAVEKPMPVPDHWRETMAAYEGHSMDRPAAHRMSEAQHFDLLILGGGMSYVGAIRAAQLGLKVGLVERDRLGGTCLNRGCIPTKAMLETADLLHRVTRAGRRVRPRRLGRGDASTTPPSAAAATRSSRSTSRASSS